MTVGQVVLAALAVCRLTQIIVHDDILRRPRQFVIVRSHRRALRRLDALNAKGENFELRPWRQPFAYKAKLITCPWCVSIWMGAAAALGMRFAPRPTMWVELALALSLIAVAFDHAMDRWLPDDVVPAPEPGPARTEEPPPEVAAVLDLLEE